MLLEGGVRGGCRIGRPGRPWTGRWCVERESGTDRVRRDVCDAEEGSSLSRVEGPARRLRALLPVWVIVVLLAGGGSLCGPVHVERFGLVVREPASIVPWRPDNAEGRGGPYRMLSRLSRLRLRFSPFPEEDPDRPDGRTVPRMPSLEVPAPKWAPVMVENPSGKDDTQVWSVPFPAPWILPSRSSGSEPTGRLEVWVGTTLLHPSSGDIPERLEAGAFSIEGGNLYVATSGEPPGALRVLSPYLEASPFPAPEAWEDDELVPLVHVWLGEDRRPALYLPPPGVVEDRLEVPSHGVLKVGLGVLDPFPGSEGNGVQFEGTFQETDGTQHVLFRAAIDPATDEGRRWKEVEVALKGLEGRTGTLRIVTQTRSVNRLYHALLADPVIVWPARRQATRPNVLVLLFDALRPDQLAAYGGPVATPGLEQLAPPAQCRLRGVSTSSWTLPAVAGLLSGLYPATMGLPDAVSPDIRDLDVLPRTPTLPQDLQRAGWYTLAVINNPFLKRTKLLDGFNRSLYQLDAAADEIVDTATATLDTVQDRWPFMAYLHFMDTHLPYQSHRWGTRDGRKVVLESHPTEFAERSVVLNQPRTPELEARIRTLYQDEIRFLDLALERLHAWMEDRGITENTVVVAVSDHGEAFWEHDTFEHGHSLSAEVNDVVLLLCPPGAKRWWADTPSGRVEAEPGWTDPGNRPVSLIDVRPTVLGFLGITPERPCQGVDLSTATGRTRAKHRTLFADGVLYGAPEHAVIDWPYTLIQRNGRPPLLYNRATDPEEHTDLAGESPDKVAELLARLREHRERCQQIRSQLAPAGTTPRRGGNIDAATRDQLRALGYLQ